MGRKKDKLIKRVVNFYNNVFKFTSPLKIILDGNFIAISFKKKLDLKENLQKLIDEKTHLIITSCIAKEITELDKNIPGLLDYILKYKISECKHDNMFPEDCIRNKIGKKNYEKYYVATQDQHLRKDLRLIPSVPILYFDNNIVFIEKPSFSTMEAYKGRENLKMEPLKDEKKQLNSQRKEVNEFMKEEYKKTMYFKSKQENLKLLRINGRLKKKAKGPNPLSCLKKKVVKINNNKEYTNAKDSEDKEKKNTVRNKLKKLNKENKTIN